MPEGGLTPLGKKLDEDFASRMSEWQEGGADLAASNLQQLDLATKMLLDEDTTLSSPAIGLAPDILQSFANPEALIVRDVVHSVQQQSIKQFLDSQFARREAEMILERAYNPALPEEENIRRIKVINDIILTAAQQMERKVRHAQKYKTVSNYEYDDQNIIRQLKIAIGEDPDADKVNQLLKEY
jgi:hypothetical protein